VRHWAASHHTTKGCSAWLIISAGFRAGVGASQVEAKSNIKEGKETQFLKTSWDKI